MDGAEVACTSCAVCSWASSCSKPLWDPQPWIMKITGTGGSLCAVEWAHALCGGAFHTRLRVCPVWVFLGCATGRVPHVGVHRVCHGLHALRGCARGVLPARSCWLLPFCSCFVPYNLFALKPRCKWNGHKRSIWVKCVLNRFKITAHCFEADASLKQMQNINADANGRAIWKFNPKCLILSGAKWAGFPGGRRARRAGPRKDSQGAVCSVRERLIKAKPTPPFDFLTVLWFLKKQYWYCWYLGNAKNKMSFKHIPVMSFVTLQGCPEGFSPSTQKLPCFQQGMTHI